MNILPKFAILSLVLLVVLSACSLEIVRNDDGSLTVESEMTEAALHEEINAAILDPLVEEFLVDLKDGHAADQNHFVNFCSGQAGILEG